MKILLTVSFDCNGVMHHEYLLQDRTVSTLCYEPIARSNSSETPSIVEKPIMDFASSHNNAPAHTSMLVREFLAKSKSVIRPQSPYSPDLAPAEIFLFPKLKILIYGKRFATIEEKKEKSKQKLLAMPKTAFQKSFEDWKKCWHK